MIELYILIFFLFLNLILIFNFSRIKLFKINIDKPDNKRKTHKNPTPLAGGLIVYINILIYWIILNFSDDLINKEIFFENIHSLNIFMLIASSIFLLGFFDDKYNIKANLKFFILIIIIFFLLLLDGDLKIDIIKFSFYKKTIILDTYSIFFTIFCFLVFLNAFNMFDGINLQSTIYSIIIFSCILFFFTESLLISMLIISLFGFSYINSQNKSFLGDSGSLLLAFIIGYLFISLYNLSIIKYTDQIVIYMIIPGIDLIRLFIIRILQKKNPLSPDRLHLHHLLIKKYSLYKTLIIIFLLIIFPIVIDQISSNNILTFITTILLYSFIVKVTYDKK